MKVLVTGGSGYLGTHVCRFFNADNFSRRVGHDVLDEEDVKVVAEYDAVIHLAAHLDKDPAAAELCFQTNASGTANVIKHLRPNAAFIYASTRDVYGNHPNTYMTVPETCSTEYTGQSALEWSKLIGERYVEYYAKARGVRACIFRMSTVYARASEGNESVFVTHYVESIKRRAPIHLPLQGAVIRDILHVEDFCRACEAFIDSAQPSGLYNLGGGARNSMTLRELVQTISRLIDIEPHIVEQSALPPNTPVRYVTDLSRIEEQLGWQPKIGIEEGLRSLF
ncbi:MAG TPA: NAD-dependent epimerase/dehydratase family protein [Pyrinomonadaceae bacterium]|nr:NAD-dependent epimerase/dehydratase family protein [Pyrinomonadaceae bacterium]